MTVRRLSTFVVMGAVLVSSLAFAACGGNSPAGTAATAEVAPTQTPSPQLPGEVTPFPVPERVRLDLADDVVVVFVEGLPADPPGKVAYVTHVPSGSQAVLDRRGKVIARHDGRGGGPAKLEGVLGDEAIMERILAVLQSSTNARPRPFTITWVNFVRFGGVTYVAKGGLTAAATLDGERVLTVEELGPEVYRVAFKLEGYIGSIRYRSQDGDAGYLRPGTPVYLVDGYARRSSAWPPSGKAVSPFLRPTPTPPR